MQTSHAVNSPFRRSDRVEFISASLSELTKALGIAACEGNQLEVDKLIRNGTSIHNFGTLGLNPLHLASRNGHVNVCRCLLDYGVSVNSINKVGKSPLHLAAVNGHAHVLKLLLSNGAVVDSLDIMHMTPLHWACDRGHLEVAKLLLRHCANSNLLNNFKKSPYQLAVANRHLEIVKLIDSKEYEYQNPEKSPKFTKSLKFTKSSRSARFSESDLGNPNILLHSDHHLQDFYGDFSDAELEDECDEYGHYNDDHYDIIDSDEHEDDDVTTYESSHKEHYTESLSKTIPEQVSQSDGIDDITDRVRRNSLSEISDSGLESNSQDKLLSTLNDLDKMIHQGNMSPNSFDAFCSTSAADLLRAQASLVPLEDPSLMLRRAIYYGKTIQLTQAGEMALSMIKPEPIIIPHGDKEDEEIEEVDIRLVTSRGREPGHNSAECSAVVLRNQNSGTPISLIRDCWSPSRSSVGPPSKRNKT